VLGVWPPAFRWLFTLVDTQDLTLKHLNTQHLTPKTQHLTPKTQHLTPKTLHYN